MHRFTVGVIALLPILAAAQSTQPATDPTPEASSRPNSVRRSRAAEALKVVGPVNLQNEADLQRVVEVVERQILGDSRLIPCDLHVKIENEATALDGYCLLAEQKATVIDDLRQVGVQNVIDRVAVGSIGGEKPFGIIENEATAVTAKPSNSEQLTAWPAGFLVYLLQQQGDAFFALGPDGYAGFVGAARLRRIGIADLKNGGTKPPSNRHVQDIETAIPSAGQLLGTKYVWGGIDASGVDCSGLTRCAFEAIGIHLPRDADQQALVGRLVAIRGYRDDLRRGNLLFFAGRRGTISHVAIYLGNDDFLEAADGKVQLSSFDKTKPNYREKRLDSFCLAKRILE